MHFGCAGTRKKLRKAEIYLSEDNPRAAARTTGDDDEDGLTAMLAYQAGDLALETLDKVLDTAEGTCNQILCCT